MPELSARSGVAISDLVGKCQNLAVAFRRQETGGPSGRLQAFSLMAGALLAEVPPSVFALEPCAGSAHDAVAGCVGVPVAVPGGAAAVIARVGIAPALERCSRNRCGGADCRTSHRARGVERPEARLCSIIRIHLAAGHVPAAIGAVGGRIAGTEILAISPIYSREHGRS